MDLSRETFSKEEEEKIITQVIEKALDSIGHESKLLTMQYIQQKYGMKFELVAKYRTEFENYLRETFHESAEIIISRMNTLFSEKFGPEPVIATNKRISDNVHFLFCDACFWSASLLATQFELKCMSCGSKIKCALPISLNERFSYEINDKKSVTLFFS